MLPNIETDIPLAKYTTLEVGGPAKFFCSIQTEAELEEACLWALQRKEPVLVLGSGSNVLISDAGFPGLVIQVNIKGIKYLASNTAVVGSGESWDEFVLESINHKLSGIECLSGIPGRVGAAVVQNIGAYGQEICTTARKVRYFDLTQSQFLELSGDACLFDYRASIFKRDTSRIVASITFKLASNNASCLAYKELSALFTGKSPSLAQVRGAVLELRKAKSMLLDPADINSRSAGCFFTNPIVDVTVFNNINSDHQEVPSWFQPDGRVKLSAGWLIEHSGFPKGHVAANRRVGLSQKHALALINLGGASAKDIYDYQKVISEAVYEHFSIQLIPEVVFVGCV
ncbi:TPA: UDP-N-acetylenolpyruvoylglucosamine reductase [candidate division WWE3 bacterium]|uniref:UDP-N-acetylenolpyruvoylglucosamine reductase n=2 Tax=Katanobacteria TaxID=422282 RepID=A0A1F4V451_UNCKA|nr:MAG: UDP-N-acetylenolpyruvoylglucosamine reductase [candidate division WWE3 bacterium RIFCSPHIGHO2_01_FULL_43_9]HAZ29233.1 UDP-N-acetylenolpyruvoylglucosamine reductase [candidate division WWE3 bacterium]